MGVTIGFVLLMIVQLPDYRTWLGILLVLVVLGASPIAVRTFLRSLAEEENERPDELRKHGW
jgi:membrane protein implicated in regulation of membrane protease activity